MSDRPVDRESGYGLLMRTVAASIEASDPDAAQALHRSAGDVEEFIGRLRAAEARVVLLEAQLDAADAVIELMTRYMDDLLDRARDVNGPRVTGSTAGPFAFYAEQRLKELVEKVAAAVSVADTGAAVEDEKCVRCGKSTGSEKARVCRECVEAASGPEEKKP